MISRSTVYETLRVLAIWVAIALPVALGVMVAAFPPVAVAAAVGTGLGYAAIHASREGSRPHAVAVFGLANALGVVFGVFLVQAGLLAALVVGVVWFAVYTVADVLMDDRDSRGEDAESAVDVVDSEVSL